MQGGGDCAVDEHKEGMAMGTITSLPRPVEVSTGISARMVVAEVIRHGRTRRTAAAVATQACDDKVCLALEAHVLSLAVTVDPAAKAPAAAKSRHPSIFNAAP